jgi:hypothetical protein
LEKGIIYYFADDMSHIHWWRVVPSDCLSVSPSEVSEGLGRFLVAVEVRVIAIEN